MSQSVDIQNLRKLARLQRHATLVAGLSARRQDGRIDPASTVREARILDAQIVAQDAAEGD